MSYLRQNAESRQKYAQSWILSVFSIWRPRPPWGRRMPHDRRESGNWALPWPCSWCDTVPRRTQEGRPQVRSRLTAIQRAIVVAIVGLAFSLGVAIGDAANSEVPGAPAMPLGDFVVTVISSLVWATVVVAGGAGIAKVVGRFRHK